MSIQAVKKTLDPCEKLMKYYTKEELINMCKTFNIKHDENATKINLAVLVYQNVPEILTRDK